MRREELDYAVRFVGGSAALLMLLIAALVVGAIMVFGLLGAFVEVMTR